MSTVTFEDERTTLNVVVRPATLRDDLTRLEMQEKALIDPIQDPQALVMSTFTFPRLICSSPSGTLTIDGKAIAWPPTPEDVLNMSVDAVNVWYTEVNRLNPAWFPNVEEVEKKLKETSQQTGSSPSVKQSPKRASRTSKR